MRIVAFHGIVEMGGLRFGHGYECQNNNSVEYDKYNTNNHHNHTKGSSGDSRTALESYTRHTGGYRPPQCRPPMYKRQHRLETGTPWTLVWVTTTILVPIGVFISFELTPRGPVVDDKDTGPVAPREHSLVT